jgi:nucleoside-diphosphate-sugar epimerase
MIPIFARRLLGGEPITTFGDDEHTGDFVNVRDLVHQISTSAKRSVSLARSILGAPHIND